MTGRTPIRDRRAAKYARGDMDTCYCCDSTPTQVHHTSYYPEETVLVCSSCHAEIHSNTQTGLEPDQPRPENYESMRREQEKEVDESCKWSAENVDGVGSEEVDEL